MNRLARMFAGFVLVLLAAFVPLSAATAQDSTSETIENIIRDLLRGALENEPQRQQGGRPGASAGVERRVPFGRREMQLSFAPLVRQTAPAVVNVYAARQVRSRSPFEGDPFFEQFFGRQFQAPPRVQSSLGSGVILDAKGLVVTNNHVIQGADEVKVALSDGREFESRIVLKDDQLDLAVLQIEGAREQFPVLQLGDSDAIEVGDLVLAIGNPFGVGQTTTSGIISALARSRLGISDFGFFIQTDAAINPGNSGGALIDMEGSLIGINTAIFSRSGGSNGIGFAIPSNIVRAFLRTAEQGGDFFERPWIGADFDQVTAAIAESLGMRRPIGAIVTSVQRGGPADRAGLNVGDVVIGMGGHVIEHPDALGYRLSTYGVGDRVDFTVIRRGRETRIGIVLQRPPESTPADEVVISGNSPFAGAKIANLSPRLAQRIGLPPRTEGVVIVDMQRNSNAARAGFRPGDIIRKISDVDMKTTRDVVRVTAEQGRWWRFQIERGGQTINQVLRF